jgi:acyl-coenzyme A thioesterase PaaI-like protein
MDPRGIDWNLLRANAGLALIGITKIPMIGFVTPRFLELSDERAVLRIRLGYRTRNHLHCMYFGAMAVGADLVIGGLAWHLTKKTGRSVSLIFKDFTADYLKRAEDDVHFICDAGTIIRDAIRMATGNPERVNTSVSAHAIVPTKFAAEPVATFRLTLSLKQTFIEGA